MSVLKVRDSAGKFIDILTIKGEKGETGESVTCIKVADEQTALSQSASNPNNIYYW